MGKTLTTASTLACPHGGTVTITAANPATANGVSLVTKDDTFVIVGCAFSTPAGPSPCTSVTWTSTDTSVKINGALTVSTDSVGVCMGGLGVQGNVVISMAQAVVTSS